MAQLDDAKKLIRTADHMVYITYPALKEGRLLVKVLEELHSAVEIIMLEMLQHEYKFKRIQLSNDPKMNFSIFEQKCALMYGLTKEQINDIKQIFLIYSAHKASPTEFVRQTKFIIMSDNLRTESLTLLRMKSYLALAKDLVRKAEIKFSAENRYEY